jgi:hypothetical protein
MNTEVTFNGNGEVREIKVKGASLVALAEVFGDDAYISMLYPPKNREGISTEQVEEIIRTIEALPFVEYAKLKCDP